MIEIFKNYNNYKKHYNEYIEWQKLNNANEIKRKIYLEQNPLSDIEEKEAKTKGNILINAIDIMDEYSQAKAEDVEIATEIATNKLQNLAYWSIATAMSIVFLKFKKIDNFINKIFKNHSLEAISVISAFVTGIISVPIVSLATKAQIGASKQGRFEAMRKDLSNPSLFAVLSDEQLKEVEEKSKKIILSKDELKSSTSLIKHNPFEFFKTIKHLLKNKEKYKNERGKFEHKILENRKKINSSFLTSENILSAKKDKQLLAKLVNKIDIASQDYAENVEMITNIMQIILLSGGLGLGFITNKLIKLLKFDRLKYGNLAKSIVTLGFTLLPSLVLASYFTEFQKLASRIGRFKAKNELLSDINNFAYIEDEKLKDINVVHKTDKKTTNMFTFIKQLFSDCKEYKLYLKTKALENRKKRKVIEKINLSPSQQQQAISLQFNLFKMFNKVDDKSQQYAESVEAVGEVVQNTFGRTLKMLGIFLGMAIAYKPLFSKNFKSNNSILNIDYTRFILGPLLGTVCGFIPAILFEIYVTQEQKKASRVANMLAIKEMDDFRQFVNLPCDNLSKQQNLINKYFQSKI